MPTHKTIQHYNPQAFRTKTMRRRTGGFGTLPKEIIAHFPTANLKLPPHGKPPLGVKSLSNRAADPHISSLHQIKHEDPSGEKACLIKKLQQSPSVCSGLMPHMLLKLTNLDRSHRQSEPGVLLQNYGYTRFV